MKLSEFKTQIQSEEQIPTWANSMIFEIALVVVSALQKSAKKPFWIKFWFVGKHIVQGIKQSKNIDLQQLEIGEF